MNFVLFDLLTAFKSQTDTLLINQQLQNKGPNSSNQTRTSIYWNAQNILTTYLNSPLNYE